ncbi:hypothetical protein BDF14DRAFT_52589 [Spinellus fusiger]|nr:hypothetical protein BDF14DRAFT_52589 [Spinellus fusiger]
MLQRLHRVQKFEPFLKETGRSFSFESLLGMGDESREISYILVGLQTHINTWMMDITADQRIKHVDEMSVRANQIVVGAALQSKTVSDKLNQVKSLKIQAQQVHLQTSQLMSSLAVIHKHFPAELFSFRVKTTPAM